jgi:hypothetical protein
MLFKQAILEGIKAGSVSLAFRKWKKPAVKKGSVINTPVGQIAILDIRAVQKKEILLKDAKRAGFDDLDSLFASLNAVTSGRIYKIAVRYHSPDPRIRLRERTDVTEEELVAITIKLDRLDVYGRQGKWTYEILAVIQAHPKLRAADLARITGREKEWLKVNIRKLKNIGLTISHDTGYTLSPLGERVINRLQRDHTPSRR